MSDDLPVTTLPGRLRVSGKVFRLGEDGPVCFIKAVTFGPFPAGAFPGDEIRIEFERIKNDLGANAIRFYEPPPIQWINDCTELGLLVFITIPWNQHVDFLNDRTVRREAEIRVRDVVARYREYATVAGYFVANEIESTLVRYLGPPRVARFLESLMEIGRAQDPEALFSYANYPTTEFMIPANQDFLAFNVYLEDSTRFARYLDRLQSLSGNYPVLISEFGVDSQGRGLEKQAQILSWHIDEVCKAGVAGTTLFSWSDQWSRGGDTITDWDFGLTNREGVPKPAYFEIEKKWENISKPFDGVKLEHHPSFSIIICTYRGSPVLEGALRSMELLDYPDFEIIVVNDGNDSKVRDLVKPLQRVRHMGIPHGGLSRARNYGAKSAKGEILVYTDDDCRVEPDWLNWLALAFSSPEEPDCVGGPNIPPPPLNFEQACVIAAPGGPAHVLVGDRVAEHVPGCNLAVKKDAFNRILGFNEAFRTAGDDVDFCWRLLDAGFTIGFHGAAYVWHLRRSSYRAYLQQQGGYGRAEAMLKQIHGGRIGDLGGAVWNGSVYEGPLLSYARSSGEVYHGKYGYEPFQLIYSDPKSGIQSALTHGAIVAMSLGILLFGFAWPGFFVIGGAGMFAILFFALRSAFRSGIYRDFDSFWARLTVAGLILAQGVYRSFVRMKGSWRLLRPVGFVVQISRRFRETGVPRIGNSLILKFWNEKGKGRDQLHEALRSLEDKFKEDETGKVDFSMGQGLFFRTDLTTVTEYHEKGKRLTRARLNFTLLPVAFITGLVVVLFIGKWITNSWWFPVAYLGIVFCEWLFTAVRASNRVGSIGRQINLDLLK